MTCDTTAHFLATAGPLLEINDAAGVRAIVGEGWTNRQLRAWLDASAPLARTAARCLGYVGTLDDGHELVEMLNRKESSLVRAAEDALWGIWLRAGSPDAVALLANGIEQARNKQRENAIRTLQKVTEQEPEFAEAHHQLALVLHAAERLSEAESSYQQAVKHNPYHFAALSGLGHIALQRDDLSEALIRYRMAVLIHPGLADIQAAIPSLEQAVARRVVA